MYEKLKKALKKVIPSAKRTFKKAKRAIKRRKRPKISKNVLWVFTGFCVLVFGAIIIWIATLQAPDYNSIIERKVATSTKIYDRTGEVLLYDIHKDEKRTNITFEEMGPNIKNATIAIEDAEFYNHNGIRVTSTLRAIFSNISGVGIGGGGSTITQQLIKNTLLTSKKSPIRKIKEWILAVKIDSTMSKEKILELYLNEVPYGGTIYGISEASRAYFNKKANELSVAESAYLAAIPQRPSYFSPYGKNKERLDERKNLVLSRMYKLGYLTEEEYNQAREVVVEFAPQELTGIKAPHFVFFIREYLEQKYGEDVVENGGLKVITTLDYKLQEKAEQIVKEGALKNQKDWNGENASLVAIDPKNGNILTMVGSRDYFDKEIQGNFNVATAKRQPGSSFKPFIYATAFNKGFTPDTVLFDLPTEFQTTCNAYGRALPGYSQSNCYMPNNYDGKFRGPISLHNALSQSVNIPAVKLFYLSGTRDSLKVAEDMGISTLEDISRYGLTLVIGGGEVTLLDITSAYGVFANEGVRNKHTGILRVEDETGEILEEFKEDPTVVLPTNTSLLISKILSDNVSRIPTFGANSPLQVGSYQVAVKTGTTNNNKDAWIVGYTPSITAGVWVGNNDNTAMKKGGAALAGPIWNSFMKEALATLPKEVFREPQPVDQNTKPILRGFWQGNESFFIDKISGKLASEFTPPETKEEVVLTNVHSILYWIDRNNITGPAPTSPENNSQFSLWEIPVQNWWNQNRYKYEATSWYQKPSEVDNIHNNESAPIVYITEPNPERIYNSTEKIFLTFTSSGMYPLKKIDVLINDIFVGNATEAPFAFSFVPEELDNLQSENEIKVISYDTAYNRSESTAIFKVQ